MNLRCSYCQMPFTIGRNETLMALQLMQAEDLHHYDVHCPHCRRSNQVSRQRLEHFLPGWQEALKNMAADAAEEKPAATEPEPDKAAAPKKAEPKKK
jgi:hypothetical protein